MNYNLLTKAVVFCGLVALAVTVRLVSETPNFGAVTAAALFAAFYFRHRTIAICVPLAIATISDQFLGGYARPVMIAVYGSYLVPIVFRATLRAGLTPARVGLGAVASSVAFYVFSNAAVWYTWYPRSWEGLGRCYSVALPFFVNTLSSDLLFSAAFFGAYALAVRLSAAQAHALAPSAA